MLKIRLMRIGATGRPFYRIVAVDDRRKRTGAYLDLIGTYNPLTNPKEIKIDQAKVDDWVKKGAQMSDGFLRIIGKAPQKPERKVRNPGKLRSNTPAEEAPAEEAPAADEPAQEQEAEQVEVTGTAEASEETAAPTEEQPSPAPEVTEDAPAAGEEEQVAEESATEESK